MCLGYQGVEAFHHYVIVPRFPFDCINQIRCNTINLFLLLFECAEAQGIVGAFSFSRPILALQLSS